MADEHAARSPAISCILPVYNGEKYLEQSIQSILDQTFRDFELIIINDGSTDKSPAIIEDKRQSDRRLVVIHQDNKGIVAALNAGIAAANGAFIARMDGDDISSPDRFEIQHAFLIENPDVVLVGGATRNIDDTGRPLSTPGYNAHRITNLLCFPPKVVTVVHPLAMMRAEAIKSIGEYSSRYPHAEDHDMFMRISELGRIENLREVILDYRFHGGNVSVQKLAQQERNAALAEIDNVRAARKKHGKRALRLSSNMFEAYVAIRILRRELGLGNLQKPEHFAGIIFKIIKGLPGSEPFTTGRLLLMIMFHAIRSIKISNEKMEAA